MSSVIVSRYPVPWWSSIPPDGIEYRPGMLPLRIVETDRPEFDEPVVELWRDDEFVGMVFWDGEETIIQIYPDHDGDVHDIEINDLLRVLELAVRVVAPEDLLEEGDGEYLQALNDIPPEGEWDDEHPATAVLTGEFDSQTVFRTDDGEGFFSKSTAMDLVRRCEELDLAVVELDGFDLEGSVLIPRPELGVAISAPPNMNWSVQRAAANAQVAAALDGWPPRPTLVAAFAIQQPDGETFIA